MQWQKPDMIDATSLTRLKNYEYASFGWDPCFLSGVASLGLISAAFRLQRRLRSSMNPCA